ncbi:hypothetical protein [Thiolapillus sp.]
MIEPGVDLSKAKTVQVLHNSEDTHNVYLIISKDLGVRDLDIVPEGADVILKYEDKWAWDISWYMVELTVKLTDGKSGKHLAAAHSIHTSLTRKSPKEMVNEVLTSLFSGE